MVRERDDTEAVGTQKGTLGRKRSEDGASTVEYALLLALIVVVCLISLAFFGESVSSRFSSTGSTIEGVSLAP